MIHIKRFTAYCFVFMSLIGLSCDDEGDTFIDGSLVKNYNIEYKSLRVRLYPDQFSVEYISKEDVPALLISIDTTQVALKQGKTYDLAKYGAITRYDEFGALPEVESGELTLETFADKDGAEVSGTFHARLISKNESSQSLRGAFKSKLEKVEF